MRQRLLLILIAVDVFFMTTFFGGKRNETMSAAAYSLEQSGHFFGFFRPIIDTLFWVVEKDHCAISWLYENRV